MMPLIDGTLANIASFKEFMLARTEILNDGHQRLPKGIDINARARRDFIANQRCQSIAYGKAAKRYPLTHSHLLQSCRGSR
jgi:hypothetical protein